MTNTQFPNASLSTSQAQKLLSAFTGSFQYSDNATPTTPFLYTGGSGWQQIPNDTLGFLTNKDFAPTGVNDVFNGLTNQFDFKELNLGDQLEIRCDVEVTTTSNNQEVELQGRFGIGSPAEFTIEWVREVEKFAGIRQLSPRNAFNLLFQDTVDSAGQFEIRSDDDLSLVVFGWYITILRRTI